MIELTCSLVREADASVRDPARVGIGIEQLRRVVGTVDGQAIAQNSFFDLFDDGTHGDRIANDMHVMIALRESTSNRGDPFAMGSSESSHVFVSNQDSESIVL